MEGNTAAKGRFRLRQTAERECVRGGGRDGCRGDVGAVESISMQTRVCKQGDVTL